MLDLSQNAPSLIFSEKLGSQTISSDNDSMEIDVIVDGIPELSETEKNSEDFIGFESEITGQDFFNFFSIGSSQLKVIR